VEEAEVVGSQVSCDNGLPQWPVPPSKGSARACLMSIYPHPQPEAHMESIVRPPFDPPTPGLRYDQEVTKCCSARPGPRVEEPEPGSQDERALWCCHHAP
jgi:hypothetical protein